MPKIGYARVSSSSQDLDIQNAKPVAAGCEVIRSETASGASRDDRSELAMGEEFSAHTFRLGLDPPGNCEAITAMRAGHCGSD